MKSGYNHIMVSDSDSLEYVHLGGPIVVCSPTVSHVNTEYTLNLVHLTFLFYFSIAVISSRPSYCGNWSYLLISIP